MTFWGWRRSYAAAGFVGLAVLLADAKESHVRESAFRKYVWGARQAYEERNFKKASALLQTYRDLGSPTDKLLVVAGCNIKRETETLRQAIKDTRRCMKTRAERAHWTEVERAKFTILMALRAGDAASLDPFMDCAPEDILAETNVCGMHADLKPGDLQRLVDTLRKMPDVLKYPSWRRFPIPPNDPRRIDWVLYTNAEEWKPCGMAGAPIMSLRLDKTGEIRIAAFAAGCLGA